MPSVDLGVSYVSSEGIPYVPVTGQQCSPVCQSMLESTQNMAAIYTETIAEVIGVRENVGKEHPRASVGVIRSKGQSQESRGHPEMAAREVRRSRKEVVELREISRVKSCREVSGVKSDPIVALSTQSLSGM